MPTHTLTFHIAAIGPSDTDADVAAIKAAVSELTDEFSIQGTTLQFHHWSLLPPGFGDTAQAYIDETISWADMDFVVGLLKQRFGTSIEGKFSGTEHEYRLIQKSYQNRKQPDLLFYFMAPTNTEPESESILRFKSDIQKDALTGTYASNEDLKQLVKSHLRKKILARIANQPVQRRLGSLPTNRRITVEMIIFAEFPDDHSFIPAILILKNFQGEEYVFDTRTMNPQDVANWIAKSMGFAATSGRTLRQYLDECNARNLEDPCPMAVAQLWLGNMLFADHPRLQLKNFRIALANVLDAETSKKIRSRKIPYILPLQNPQIMNDSDGRKSIDL